MGGTEKAALAYVHYTCKQLASGKLLCNTGSAAWRSVTTERGSTGDEVWGGGFRRRGHMYTMADSHCCCMAETNTTL